MKNRNKQTVLMLKALLALSIIVLGTLAVSCKPKKSTEPAPDFSIYGIWRYVISADVEHGETWHNDGLSLISLYDDGGTCLVTYRNSVYYGLIHRTGDYWHQYNAFTRMDLDSMEAYSIEDQGDPYTFLFGYDPETKRLIERDETVENYFEWVEESTATFLLPETNGYDPMLDESFPVAYIAHFNNETIPMTVFYSPLSYGGYYLNSLEFMYDGAKQTVRIENGEDMMPISNIDADNIGGISLDDFNFDGYADIAVFGQSGYGSNEWYEIYLYNPQTKSYYRHEKLSEMCGVRADTETKTVKSSGRTSFYGYNFDEYKWDNGQLTLIYSEKYDTVGDSDLYEHATGTLQNGSWTEQTEYFRYDSDGNEIKVEIME